MSINRVEISGNLVRDAEMRSSRNGNAILTFSVAVNDRRKNQGTGEWEDVASFVDCVMFGRRAEALETRLLRGTKVYLAGKLKQDTWEADDGSKRSKLEVIVDDIDLDWKSGGMSASPKPASSKMGVYDEEIPF